MSSEKAGAVPSLDQAIARLREMRDDPYSRFSVADEVFDVVLAAAERARDDSKRWSLAAADAEERAEKSPVSAPFSEGSATGEDEWKRVLQEVGGAVWAVREFVHLPDGQAPTGKSSMGLDLFKSIVSASVRASKEGT